MIVLIGSGGEEMKWIMHKSNMTLHDYNTYTAIRDVIACPSTCIYMERQCTTCIVLPLEQVMGN